MPDSRLVLILFVAIILTSPLAKAERLKVAFAHWPPWKVHSGASFDGIDARVIRALAQRTGVEMEFIKCPWIRCISFMKDGRADLITSFGKTTERQQYAHYLGPPYFTDKITFWINKSSYLKIRSYEDLHGLSIGLAKGSVYFPRFDHDSSLYKVQLDLEDQMFLMLDSDRIDTFIGYETTMNYQLAKGKFFQQFRSAEFKIEGQEYYLGMSKQSRYQHLKNLLATELSAMREEGEIKRIIDNYIEQSSGEAE